MILNNSDMNFKIFSEDEKYFHGRLKLIKPGIANNWDFTEKAIREGYESFKGVPVLCAYKGMKIGDDHNFTKTLNSETLEFEFDYRAEDAERIVGYIPFDADVRLEDIDGGLWVIADCVLFKFYNIQLVNDIIKRGFKDVSAEVNTIDGPVTNGITRIDAIDALGVTILGDDVPPAVKGASIKALSARFKEVLKSGELETKLNSKKRKKVKRMNKEDKIEKLRKALSGEYEIVLLSEDEGSALVVKDREPYVATIKIEDDGELNADVLSADKNVLITATENNRKVTHAFILKELLLAQSDENKEKALADCMKKCAEIEKENGKLKAAETLRRNKACAEAVKAKHKKDKDNYSEDVIPTDDEVKELAEKAEKGDYASEEDALNAYLVLRGKKMDSLDRNEKQNTKTLSWQSNKNMKGYDEKSLIDCLDNINFDY